jgi:hypothetical protein
MIELGKQYRTHDGREVRIYAVDGNGSDVIHGAYRTADGQWELAGWRADGSWIPNGKCAEDLIEVKPKITRTYWLAHNSYGSPPGAMWEKPKDMGRVHPDVIAITGPHEITFTEGEGLHS